MVSFNGLAQRYQPGYIITKNNDTLYGEVADRSYGAFATIYKRVRFKDGGFIAKRFSPYDINGYMVDGAVFASMWLDVERVLLKETYVSQAKQGRKVFLKVISNNQALHYYQLEQVDGDNGFVDYIPLFKKYNSNELVRVTQGILGLKKKRLTEYFSDCPELVEKITNDELKTPIEILNFYNNWASNNSQK